MVVCIVLCREGLEVGIAAQIFRRKAKISLRDCNDGRETPQNSAVDRGWKETGGNCDAHERPRISGKNGKSDPCPGRNGDKDSDDQGTSFGPCDHLRCRPLVDFVPWSTRSRNLEKDSEYETDQEAEKKADEFGNYANSDKLPVPDDGLIRINIFINIIF